MNGPGHWANDPAEIDRFLDRELPPEDLCLREAEAAADASLARRVADRRALLEALQRAGQAEPARRDGLAALEARVRMALARDRSGDASLTLAVTSTTSRRLRLVTWIAAAAAVLLVGFTWTLVGPTTRDAEAYPREALWAADLLKSKGRAERVATCGGQETTSPFRFTLVEKRELSVRGCLPETERSEAERALLERVTDLEVVGYVAVPDAIFLEHGAEPGPEIGVTRLEDAVVFDVRQGGVVYYLAVSRDLVDRRGTCAACHDRTHENGRNPHFLKERRSP